MDIEWIKECIPHREPFLFVDEVVELKEESIQAKRFIRKEEDFFRGHYPNNPILPGVLMCESVFQTAAILLVSRLKNEGIAIEGRTPILSRIRESKFKRMVLPGDTIETFVKFKEQVGQFYFLTGRIENEGKTVLTIDFALALIEKDKV